MFPAMQAPLHPRAYDPLFERAMFGAKNRKRTWRELAIAVGVPSDEAEIFLFNASAFPFARARYIVGQLRHVLRHKVCFDDPGSNCQSKSLWRHA